MAFVPSSPLLLRGQDDSNQLAVSNLVVTSLPTNAVLVSGVGNVLATSNVTPTELSYLSGLTSNVQQQLSSVSVSGLASDSVVVSNASGALATSNVTSTELGFLKGTRSALQTQLDAFLGSTLIGTPNDWSTAGPTLATTPLSFTPLPRRTYVVNAELGLVAPANDHTVSFGLKWPSPLLNSNSATVTTMYQESSSSSVVKHSSAYVTDPAWTFNTATLANTLIMASLYAVFTTGNVAPSAFSIVANTSNLAREVYLVYGSHLTYQMFTNVPNFAPSPITGASAAYTLASNGAPTVLSLASTDPEGQPITWSYAVAQGSLGSTATVTQNGNVFTITPSANEANAGTFTLRFGASDGTTTVYKNVQFTLPSTPPAVANVESTYTLSTLGNVTTITLGATDAENSPLSYSYDVVSGSVGDIATVSQSDNVFTITPSIGETYAGSFTLRFGVSDGVHTTYTNSAVFTKPSSPPTIANVNPTYTLSTVGNATVVSLVASDPENTPLSYSYEVVSGALGNIASVSQSANVFTITPSLGETYAGSFTLKFGVTDGTNVAYTNSAVFTKPSTAPTITSSLNASYTLATNGTPTVITVTATDPEGTPLTYGYEVVSGSLGSTATVTQNGGQFTVTPTTNTANGGTFQLRFSASDGKNTVYTNGATFSLNFDSTPPTITSTLNSSYALATNGTATTITITATDPGAPITYGYQVTSGSLGSTASISQTNNVFTITPSTNTANGGLFALRFWARDNFNNTAYTSSATFTLDFTPPTITSNLNSSYALDVNGVATQITITATDANGPLTYGYQVTSGSLGSTATVSQSDNVFTITPSTNVANEGSFALRFYARDAFNNTAYTNSATFTLRFVNVVAVGSGYTNTIATSSNGINWTGRGRSVFSSTGYGVAWNGSLWVAVGTGTNSIATSPNGIDWTGRGESVFSLGYAVAWNGSMWVAVGQGPNTIATSYDGINWTGRGSPVLEWTGYGVAWNGSLWVAVGEGPTYTIATSSDGVNWTGRATTSLFSSGGRDVKWNGSMWVAGGYGTNNTIATSYDGYTWTGRGTSVFSLNAHGLAWNGSMWVAVGSGTNSIATSTDGVNWTARSADTFGSVLTFGVRVAGNGSLWVAVGGQSNTIATSPDGVNWTGRGSSMFDSSGRGVAFAM